MNHPMQGKTLAEIKAWEEELIEGKRGATIYDVEWLLTRFKVERDKAVYYMNLSRFKGAS